MQRWLSKKTVFNLLTLGLISSFLLLGACSKAPVTLTSAQIVGSLDKGSGNFDRVLQICFKEPLKSDYFHKVVIITKEDVKITGEGMLRPLASDPDNKCHLRNVYLYIHKDSPVDARQLIKDYVVPGNVRQVLVQVLMINLLAKSCRLPKKSLTICKSIVSF
ncbi:hypothetical protein [Thiomicrorhabdus aquaedulcis]|uniref:hypothetical protein n=1 Tax=Thiomicrorhabdus aquaedulcis TaxID=2211106 RepID=UPI001E60EA74|nr:hypothetical protein [Thiomicrorhabdus aquaedulcis]